MNHDHSDIRKDLSKYASSICLVSSGASHTVLFVDDDTNIKKALKPLLHHESFSKHCPEAIRLVVSDGLDIIKIMDAIKSHYLISPFKKKETT